MNDLSIPDEWTRKAMELANRHAVAHSGETYTALLSHLRQRPAAPVAPNSDAENVHLTVAPSETVQGLTDERILEIAHRQASIYTHRSDPTQHAYGFVPHTLLKFARAIERELAATQGDRT